MAGDGWRWPEMAGDGWRWLEMAGDGWRWLGDGQTDGSRKALGIKYEMAEIGEIGEIVEIGSFICRFRWCKKPLISGEYSCLLATTIFSVQCLVNTPKNYLKSFFVMVIMSVSSVLFIINKLFNQGCKISYFRTETTAIEILQIQDLNPHKRPGN